MVLASVLSLPNGHILVVIGDYGKSKSFIKSANFDFKASCGIKSKILKYCYKSDEELWY